MSEEQALLAAIHAHPLDDAPRLVYADWLDEHGGKANVARAEFIRVQCELELLAPGEPRYPALEKRERALLKAWRKEWVKPLKTKFRPDTKFSRGFPEPNLSETTSFEELTELTETDLQAAPLWRYEYGVSGSRELDLLLRWPQLHRVTTLALAIDRRSKGWAKRLAACDGLRNVTELDFTDSPLTVADLRTVLDAWAGRRLRELVVNECRIGDVGIRLVATHPATAHLRRLYAHSIRCTGRGMKAVADGPNLDRLVVATFGHNKLGDAGGRHLLRWKALAGIRELFLMNTKIPKRIADQLRARLGERVDLTK
jgi:uncharacterized protein (TIGR02996 family)